MTNLGTILNRDGFCGRGSYFLRVFFYLFEFVPFILLQEKIEAVQ